MIEATMENIELFELCGKERQRVFSPYCWIVRYALAHKGLDYTATPIKFGEKDRIAFSEQPLVPVLRDNSTTITDSWEILTYLDEKHGDRPSLFPNGTSSARFIKHWVESTLYPLLAPIVIMDIHNHLDVEDQLYFRKSREERFGMSLEDFTKKAADTRVSLEKALEPLRRRLQESAYIEGAEASASDYIALGLFLWARGCSKTSLLKTDDPIYSWRDRLFKAYDGLGFSTLGYDL